jgi:sirohydrochlorin cobaltochelatase
MNDTILLVGHGSRDANGNREVEQFAQQWRAQHPKWRIELCFIEFADVLLDEGLANAAKNSQRVIVIPLILNAAGHVKMEIPQHIAEARTHFPACQFIYAPHLGACDDILAILKRRLNTSMNALDMPDPASTGIILLGRGSSDRQANGDVAKMARWLHELCLEKNSRHELVDIAFTGITYPRLERVVQRQIQQGVMQIVILPYYLFAGTLIERIKRQARALQQQYPQIRFHLGDYFGFEKEIFHLLDERAHEAGVHHHVMPCDGCRFRDIAQEMGHGHSHSHTHEHTHDHTHHHDHHHDDHHHSHHHKHEAAV